MEKIAPRINTKKVLIKPLAEEAKSSVVMSNTKNARAVKGEIIGMGKMEVETEFKVGDIVLFGEYSGVELFLEPKVKSLLLDVEEIYLAL